MSRYQIAPRTNQHEVLIGWDNPLNTYFAQVADGKIEDFDEDHDPLLWIGCSYGEIPSVSDLRKAISPYAEIPPDTYAALLSDQDSRDQRPGPTMSL
jgi:hypothetical protein